MTTSNPKSTSISREGFLKHLQDSGILSEADIRKTLEALPGDSANADGAAFAEGWVRAGKLTAYQARCIADHRLTDLQIGNYDVLDLLGSGGMGTVFKARHRRMKRVVALKLLSRKVAEGNTFLPRFQREVETIAQLSHQNIVMAFDADEAEVGPFLVMEFVNGRDLASEVQKEGPLSVARAVHFTLQAAQGLAYAHARGIVHRDVKPANLLQAGDGIIKVADLGLARLSTNANGGNNPSSLTQVGGIVGTPDFMPPEQALDATTTDHRGDIYSLGCTLFFLLTGRVPYVGNSLMALLLQHRDAPIPALSSFRPGVPDELEAIYRRMVAKKPEDRYLSMAEVVAALEAVKGKLSTSRTVAAVAAPPPAKAAPNSEATVAADSWDQIMSKVGQPIENPSGPAGSAPPVERRIAELVIVLVEPSRTQANIIRKYIQQLGIDKIHCTGSGKEAIELARMHHANALLSSMHLSDMTGRQLAEALHQLPDCSQAGIVLATSGIEIDASGADRQSTRTVLMPKPFDLRKLAEALAQATGVPVADMLLRVSPGADTVVSIR